VGSGGQNGLFCSFCPFFALPGLVVIGQGEGASKHSQYSKRGLRERESVCVCVCVKGDQVGWAGQDKPM
jgi:hypothetical protein